jgi:hypothetical protein
MQYDPRNPEAGPIRKLINHEQGTDYLREQATLKANEERDAMRQQAQGEREAAAAALKNADTLREQARAKQDKNRADFEYIRIVDRKNPSVQKEYNDLTRDQQNSLGQIADTVKERDKIQTTAENKTPVERYEQFVDAQGNKHYVPPSVGAANGWTLDRPNTAGGTRGTAVLEKERAKNDALLANVNDAIAALSVVGPTGTEAVGIKGYMPVGALDRIDPQGILTRTIVQKIGAKDIHELFGSALTKTEKGRAGFAPDPSYNSVMNLARLNALKRELINSTKEINKSIGNMRGGSGNAPAPDNASAKPQTPKKTTKSGGAFGDLIP